MDVFRLNLKKILREVDEISIYDLHKKLDMELDTMLVKIMEIVNDFKKVYRENVTNMTHGNKDFMSEFFKQDIVDLGFLCQHKIVEIRKGIGDKLDTMGHQLFYDGWLINRGY